MYKTQIFLILLFGIALFFTYFPIKKEVANRRAFYIYEIAIFFLVLLRSETIADYANYVYAFEGYGDSGLRFEPGFHLIRFIVRMTGAPVFWGFFLYAIVCVLFKLSYIKRYPHYLWAASLVYLSGVIVSHDMVAIRAGAATSFFLFAVDYKEKNETWKMYVALFCALMFHYSALALFILPFINPHKPNRLLYLSALLACHILAVMGIFLNQYIELLSVIGALETVVGMHQEGDVMNFMNMLQLGHIVICVTFWINIKKLESYSKNSILYLKLYTIGLCVMPLLAQMVSVALRLSELFLVVEILLIPIGFSAIIKRLIISKYLLIIYSIILFFFTITSDSYWLD